MAATVKKTSGKAPVARKKKSKAKASLLATDSLDNGPVTMTSRERRCIVSHKVLPKAQLIRFVMAPNGWIVPDIRGKLPGRGVWVSAERSLIQQAIKRNHFSKAFDHAVIVSPDLVQSVLTQLQLWVADLLGLAKKASEVAVGFEKVETALRAGRVGLVIQANDAAKNGTEKIHRLVKNETVVIAPLDAGSLGRALGRDNAVHVAVTKGRLAEKLIAACNKLISIEG